MTVAICLLIGILVGFPLGWFFARYKRIEIHRVAEESNEFEEIGQCAGTLPFCIREDETALDPMQKKNREFLRERGFEVKRKRMD